MTTLDSLLDEKKAAQVFRGEVLAMDAATILVGGAAVGDSPLACDVLSTSETEPLELEPGDYVLVWAPPGEAERGVVLGRIGAGKRRPDGAVPQPVTPPDEVVVEAGRSLTLRCGDGSITLREDGKVLIKGRDLVSRARRTNRIKGGSVSIN